MPRRLKPSRHQEEVYLHNKNLAHETHEASTPKIYFIIFDIFFTCIHNYIVNMNTDLVTLFNTLEVRTS